MRSVDLTIFYNPRPETVFSLCLSSGGVYTSAFLPLPFLLPVVDITALSGDRRFTIFFRFSHFYRGSDEFARGFVDYGNLYFAAEVVKRESVYRGSAVPTV